ncbi:hypothetical protein [Kitasatospora griseola]|uniref:hypothetical protein n=1 Tax=Kitasatospora griseola TaxID=2064 RepID=UPI003823E9F3
MRSDERPVAELAAYGRRVLDTLGIRHGAAQLEIKLTPDGPRLVEAGARMSGLPYCTAELLGEGQLERIVDACVRPERFRARAGRGYRRRPAFAWAALVARRPDGRSATGRSTGSGSWRASATSPCWSNPAARSARPRTTGATRPP